MNNVKLFNRLTHDCHGLVDNVLIKKLLKEFDNYLLLKKVLINDIGCEIDKADVNNNNIIFVLKPDKDMYNEIIENLPTTITHKQKKYKVITKEKNEFILIKFEL